ncbi:hypothetical protein [Longispora albida]|uniref:hypothetical protein n=1 Tax=Longispora albida TaxID=203523 RepID=UPI0004766E3D|nr:hypothetical protein [Longispora albida]
MRVELWLIPLLVTAGIVVVEYGLRVARDRGLLPAARRLRLRTGALVGLAGIMLALLWQAWSRIGTSVMANLAAVLSTLVEVITLWLTYQSYRELRSRKDQP